MNQVKVLLVDDDEDDFILTKDILRESVNGDTYELSWCSNFSEAINAMLKSHYDVYLVDYRLGRESGIDLLNEAVKSNCTEPIIVLTGKGDHKIDREAMRLGAADYLVKDNITGQALERSIRYAIAHNKTLQRLKYSESKFRILFERSKDPMLITDMQGHVIEANPSAVNFFETTHSDFQKLNAADLYNNPADRETYVNAMNEDGSIADFEFEFKTQKGNVKLCSISSFLQVSQHANEEHYYSILHDLTYRLQQEKDGSLNEKLAATERIAKRLSNEIQNPLSNINLAIDELSESIKHEEQLVLVDIIKTNCQRLNGLTSELIESTETISFDLNEVELRSLLTNIIENSRRDFDVNINCRIHDGPLIIKADEQALRLALRSIIQNASEAISGGSGTVNIIVEKKSSSIRILISDSGPGISPDNIEKVFEPFFTTKAKSAGLGLTHAQRIIHAHKGKIHINSSADSGTLFSISFPC